MNGWRPRHRKTRIARMAGAMAAALFALTIGADARQGRAARGNTDAMAEISREYVRLVLALGEHDKDYVDAYYGPEDLKAEALRAKLSLADIGTNVQRLGERLAAAPAGSDELSTLRHH